MRAPGYKHLYGPVPSRRLGNSLGIDLVPPKICPYDCIYCQLGRTSRKTMERREYVPVDQVLAELEARLGEGVKPDCISLAGSGEPTLNSEIGVLLKRIKEMTDIPVTVLTNGALLWMDEVREGLMAADIVLPSLDAGNALQFKYVNRPCARLSYSRMVAGISDFTREFPGRVWLEVMLLGQVSDTLSMVSLLADQAGKIAPEKIQLNTVFRPPVDQSAVPVPRETMQLLAEVFPGRVEIISTPEAGPSTRTALSQVREEDILDLLNRRPCTTEDVARGLGIHLAESIKCLKELADRGKVVNEMIGERIFYRPGRRGEGTSEPGEGE